MSEPSHRRVGSLEGLETKGHEVHSALESGNATCDKLQCQRCAAYDLCSTASKYVAVSRHNTVQTTDAGKSDATVHLL